MVCDDCLVWFQIEIVMTVTCHDYKKHKNRQIEKHAAVLYMPLYAIQFQTTDGKVVKI